MMRRRSILHHSPRPTFRARLLAGTALAPVPAVAPSHATLAARLDDAGATFFQVRRIEAAVRQRFGPGGAIYDTRRFGWPG